MKKIFWGILSTSNFALTMIVPAVKGCTLTNISGIASRDQKTASLKAAEHNIPNAYGSYEELLTDPDIEAIYNPLPNHMHLNWTKKALEAGKHVLCEKPITLNKEEANELAEFAKQYPNLKVMEAFMYRLHPRILKLRELLDSNIIGKLKHAQTFFSYHNINPENIRNQYDAGGGGLLDIGCYCISLLRYIFNSEPQKVIGEIEMDPGFNTDRLVSAILDYGYAHAAFTCSTQIPFDQSVKIYGDRGRIEIHRPFTPELDEPSKILVFTEEKQEEIVFDACNHYTVEFDAFSRAIIDDTPVPTPLTDAVNNMKVIDAVSESSLTQKWISII
ncbi:MAG: Gfo/Idh/MocA family oxidoreductase [Melioribacteraceae bacterium]|nr:Gfo/Idh/MocA family oxidoreductase [Melioribacteraceae bacterium]